MSGKNFMAIVLAVIVGIVGFVVLKWVVSIALNLIGWVIAAAVIGGIAYFAYRKFNNMLSSGKRLT